MSARMASFKDMMKLAFKRNPQPPATDAEQAVGNTQIGTSDQSTLQPPLPHLDVHGRPELDPTDKLNLFRHLTGITSHPSMAQSAGFFSNGNGRPAPNLGIYTRVIRNEQTAKIGFKYFSMLINGCLGLQIVVAAALTALGAAGGSRGAVTVFGAINTVIAGILTFLKGSGLPNRFKYYQTEWKRVREFIEQRERDFSRPGCEHDVYGVVDMVEKMYFEVKAEVDASQPERFAGNLTQKPEIFGHAMPTHAFNHNASLPGLGLLNEKSKAIEAGFGNKVKNLASEITHYAHEARDVVKELETKKERIQEGASRELDEYAAKKDRLEHTVVDKVKDLTADIDHKAREVDQAARDAEARQKELVNKAVQEARENLARAEEAARRTIAAPITVSVSPSVLYDERHDKDFKEKY
ncbi:hypothetical protein FKW77_007562 [Venturia effusa]|uniref:SMODS and SLOG-associating 2TM effector domain-containing protein n=1 Tax=Venturia effusa TaxID=50376 RepID=A0A517KZS5_9PEZI|nr:hypothetical protein FKW77_007562 [Venturia effusa]